MATKAELVQHQIEVGTTKYSVKLPDIYSTIGTVLGIKKLGENDKAGPPVDIGDLIANGQAMHLRVGYGERGKLKYKQVLCSASKLDTAVGELDNKSIGGNGGGTIRTVGFRRKRRRG